MTSSSDQLPPGWEKVQDSLGRTYYANRSTGASSWERPAARGEVSLDKGTGKSRVSKKSYSDWTRHVHAESGKTYYYNKVTKESSWDHPREVQQRQSDNNEMKSIKSLAQNMEMERTAYDAATRRIALNEKDPGFSAALKVQDAFREQLDRAVATDGGSGDDAAHPALAAAAAPRARTRQDKETSTPGADPNASDPFARAVRQVKLKVKLLGATNLKNADWAGKSDPFCICRVLGKPDFKFQTEVVNNNLNPEWNAEFIVEDFVSGDTLDFSIFDHDPTNQNDLLGTATLTSKDFLQNGFHGALPLIEPGPKKGKGVLNVSIEVMGGAPHQSVLASTPGAATSASQPLARAVRQVTAVARLGGGGARREVKLKVKLLGATNLKNADWVGKSDPFCICQVPGKPDSKFQTEVVNNNLNPEWNAEFIVEDFVSDDTLDFSIFDHDPTNQNALLGTATLTSKDFLPNGFHGALPLIEPGLKKGKGFLDVSIEVMGGAPHQSVLASAPGAATNASDPLAMAVRQVDAVARLGGGGARPEVKLKVKLLGATNLKNADWVGKSDPFCICQVLGKPDSKFQTEVVNNNLNPEWNAEFIVEDFVSGDTLDFSIFDHDPTNQNARLGTATLTSKDFLPNGFHGALPLIEPGLKKGKGVLNVSIEVMGGAPHQSVLALGAARSSVSASSAVAPARSQTSAPAVAANASDPFARAVHQVKLKIKLLGATNLKNADWAGKSDPFCICRVLGKQDFKFQTEVAHNSLNPEWNAEFIVDDFASGDALDFSVFDHDPTNQNDLLGTAGLTSKDFLPNGFHGALPLVEPGLKKGKGVLDVSIEVLASTPAEVAGAAAAGARRPRREVADAGVTGAGLLPQEVADTAAEGDKKGKAPARIRSVDSEGGAAPTQQEKLSGHAFEVDEVRRQLRWVEDQLAAAQKEIYDRHNAPMQVSSQEEWMQRVEKTWNWINRLRGDSLRDLSPRTPPLAAGGLGGGPSPAPVVEAAAVSPPLRRSQSQPHMPLRPGYTGDPLAQMNAITAPVLKNDGPPPPHWPRGDGSRGARRHPSCPSREARPHSSRGYPSTGRSWTPPPQAVPADYKLLDSGAVLGIPERDHVDSNPFAASRANNLFAALPSGDPIGDACPGGSSSEYMGFRDQSGRRDGFGVCRGHDGNTYTGQWVGGRREGHGSLFFPGGVFEGKWVRGNAHGRGAVYFKNGDSFDGAYINNRKHGVGCYRWTDGAEERGDYCNGLKIGWHHWSRNGDRWELHYSGGNVNAARQVSRTASVQPAFSEAVQEERPATTPRTAAARRCGEGLATPRSARPGDGGGSSRRAASARRGPRGGGAGSDKVAFSGSGGGGGLAATQRGAAAQPQRRPAAAPKRTRGGGDGAAALSGGLRRGGG